MSKGLTPKQKRFAEEYIIDCNATKAYTRAGYAGNEATARVNAAKLLTKTNISSYIRELQQGRQHRTKITADRVLQEIARVAFSNIADVVEFDESGVIFKNSKDLDDEVKAAIVEVSSDVTYGKGGEDGEAVPIVKRKVRMHNKLQALDLLAKHLGLTSDFNVAVQTLKSYDIHLKQSTDGWYVENGQDTTTTEG